MACDGSSDETNQKQIIITIITSVGGLWSEKRGRIGQRKGERKIRAADKKTAAAAAARVARAFFIRCTCGARQGRFPASFLRPYRPATARPVVRNMMSTPPTKAQSRRTQFIYLYIYILHTIIIQRCTWEESSTFEYRKILGEHFIAFVLLNYRWSTTKVVSSSSYQLREFYVIKLLFQNSNELVLKMFGYDVMTRSGPNCEVANNAQST